MIPHVLLADYHKSRNGEGINDRRHVHSRIVPSQLPPGEYTTDLQFSILVVVIHALSYQPLYLRVAYFAPSFDQATDE